MTPERSAEAAPWTRESCLLFSRKFVGEQSCGEWGDDLERLDAEKLASSLMKYFARPPHAVLVAAAEQAVEAIDFTRKLVGRGALEGFADHELLAELYTNNGKLTAALNELLAALKLAKEG
jgi:hypothetical protein